MSDSVLVERPETTRSDLSKSAQIRHIYLENSLSTSFKKEMLQHYIAKFDFFHNKLKNSGSRQ